MRSRLLLVLLALLTLAAAACGSDSDESGSDDRSETGSAAAVGEGGELPDGIAATVDGEEITVEEVESDAKTTLASPALKEQLQKEADPRQVEEAVRAQSLSALVAFRILEAGADEMGVEPTDEDVASARAELVEAAGGEEQLQSQLDATGLSEQQIDEQLRALATVNLVGERLLEEQGEGEQPPGGEQGPAAQQRQQAAQQWLAERMAEADVVVSARYGRWDPASGQVAPPSAGESPGGQSPGGAGPDGQSPG